jgi:hypothetical protein
VILVNTMSIFFFIIFILANIIIYLIYF